MEFIDFIMYNGLFFLTSVIVTFAAIFGLINHKILKLPSSIGLVVVALIVSIAIIIVDLLLPDLSIAKSARLAFLKIDFLVFVRHYTM